MPLDKRFDIETKTLDYASFLWILQQQYSVCAGAARQDQFSPKPDNDEH